MTAVDFCLAAITYIGSCFALTQYLGIKYPNFSQKLGFSVRGKNPCLNKSITRRSRSLNLDQKLPLTHIF